jgi:hypothetical protein
MKTDKPTPARQSKVGHYGVQYPDLDTTGVIIPRDTELKELHWVGGATYKAYLWERREGSAVVWIDDNPLKDFE